MLPPPPDSSDDDSRSGAVSDPSPPADWVEVSDRETSAGGPVSIPVLPVRDVVVFPGTVTPLIFGRERSLRALRRARSEDALGLLVAQRDPDEDDPAPDELYPVGTVGRCLQALELPDGTVRAVFEGMTRARITHVLETEPFMKAEITPVVEVRPEPAPWVEALKRRALEDFEEATELSRRIPRRRS
jgi:ATP-dependent Lon protease